MKQVLTCDIQNEFINSHQVELELPLKVITDYCTNFLKHHDTCRVNVLYIKCLILLYNFCSKHFLPQQIFSELHLTHAEMYVGLYVKWLLKCLLYIKLIWLCP
jgi:hypothetical protein